jgi:hypothetical protein
MNIPLLSLRLIDRSYLFTGNNSTNSSLLIISKIKSFTHELIEIDKPEIPIGKLFRNNVLKVLQ